MAENRGVRGKIEQEIESLMGEVLKSVFLTMIDDNVATRIAILRFTTL